MSFIDSIADTELQVLAEQERSLHDEIQWLRFAPFPDAISNIAVNMQDTTRCAAQREIELDRKFDGVKPRLPRLRALLPTASARLPIEKFIIQCAELSYQSRLAQDYALQRRQTKQDYYNYFFNGMNACFSRLVPDPDGMIDVIAEQRKLQLLALCWGLAFTHVNAETGRGVQLNQHTLPSFLKTKAHVLSVEKVVTQTGKGFSKATTARRALTDYDLGFNVQFPDRELTLTPVNNKSYVTKQKENKETIEQAILEIQDHTAKGYKAAIFDTAVKKIRWASSAVTVSEQETRAAHALTFIGKNEGALKKHRYYSPLIYACIAIGFVVGLIPGAIMWALADHKRKSLKKIDWKQSKQPKAARIIVAAKPLLKQVQARCIATCHSIPCC
jgi:hypothetical protein